MTTNVGGPAHELCTDAMKFVCPFCNSTFVQISKELVNNNELFSGSATNVGADPLYMAVAGIESIALFCLSCGMIFGKPFYWLDTVSAQAVPAITLTTYDNSGGIVNDLAGYYIYCLGGTDIGSSFKIVSNTKANPTVLTLDASPNIDINGKEIIISAFKQGV